ncbi:unnamed protein product [Ilex paraguariensis]|uniref:TRAF-type domain-containing protein n=1 Tax=Ilex paraguariensis TaxID=185542 RepID=A0ABC8S849_9AQUA
MEINGFWLIQRREDIAQTLLKNVDFKNMSHCNKKFNSEEELSDHAPHCSFRTINCTNERCNARFSAAHKENNIARRISILTCFYIFQVVHKEASVEDLKQRAEQLEKSSSPGQLAEAQDVRSLTLVIKNFEAKLGPRNQHQQSYRVQGVTCQRRRLLGINH